MGTPNDAPSQNTRRKFAAMVGVYFVGTLNDNFCRQCVMLLAVAWGLTRMQSYITVLFTTPFIIFAAYAGFFADRFSKRSVVIGVKLLSFLAYILGIIGFYLNSWPIILVTVFILGFQATVFSPAINGIIPELYPPAYVVTANGIIAASVNIAILLGIAGAGLVLDVKGTVHDVPLGMCLAAAVGLSVAFITLVISFFVPRFPAASPNARFPWQGPWESVITLVQTGRDSLLANSIFAKAFFWFAASLQILVINPLGLTQFGLTKTMTSVLIVIELVGVGVGSLLAPLIAKGEKWYRVLAPAAILMAIAMFAVTAIPYLPSFMYIPLVIAALAVLGIAGGVFCIPVTSFVQVRPAPEIKGKMIASSNFADFVGILLSGAVFYIFNQMNIMPTNCFAIVAVLTLAAAGWLLIALREKKLNAY
jgi:acyl-[acyl-carrier-protein]-phospholipid O-acyltransferase / long-chain-fatty-acid--[acyl-carrier-protein] ligase